MDANPDFDDAERRHQEVLANIRRRSRRIAASYTLAAVALIPWTAYLAVTLPKRNLTTHYRAAWVGFDLVLAGAIILTAYLAFRMDARVQFPATATATLLLVDAWFDVMTSNRGADTLEALVLAFSFEIPAAVFSLWLARRVHRNAALLIEHDLALRSLRQAEEGRGVD